MSKNNFKAMSAENGKMQIKEIWKMEVSEEEGGKVWNIHCQQWAH